LDEVKEKNTSKGSKKFISKDSLKREKSSCKRRFGKEVEL